MSDSTTTNRAGNGTDTRIRHRHCQRRPHRHLQRRLTPPQTRLWLAYYPNCAQVEIAQGFAHIDRRTPALECETPRRFIGTAFILGELAVLAYFGEITDFAPLIPSDRLVRAHPHPLGNYPPRASTAEQLRGALMTLGHWAPAHPLPYDDAGVSELIGPRSIQKNSRRPQAQPDRHRDVAAAIFSRYMPKA